MLSMQCFRASNHCEAVSHIAGLPEQWHRLYQWFRTNGRRLSKLTWPQQQRRNLLLPVPYRCLSCGFLSPLNGFCLHASLPIATKLMEYTMPRLCPWGPGDNIIGRNLWHIPWPKLPKTTQTSYPPQAICGRDDRQSSLQKATQGHKPKGRLPSMHQRLLPDWVHECLLSLILAW